MSPEQASGTDIGGQSDLYAVGVLLWEAAARARRFPKLPEVNILSKLIAREPPEPPLAERFGLPPEVDEVCMRALAADPSERFGSAADFRAALEELFGWMGRSVSTEDVGRYLTEHFADDRARLQALIEKKTRESDEGADITVASLISMNESGSLSLASANRPKQDTLSGADQDTRLDAVASGRPEPRRSLKPWLAVSAGLAALAGVGLWLAWPSSAPEGPTPAAEVAPRAPVTVRVSAAPAAAKLYWDGRLLDGNPYSETREPSQDTITLRAEAEGHASQSAIISLDADRNVAFKLESLPVAAPVTLDLDDVGSASAATPKAAVAAPAPARPKRKSKVKLDTSNPWGD
jgi:serine/threonine-protein kinase